MVTVLLVDDDDLVRTATARMLTRLSYRVISFCDGALAREFLKTSDMHVDLIVCDVEMPLVGGIEFYRWLSTSMPQLSVAFLFFTGSDEQLDAHEDVRAVPRLEKPAYRNEFVAAVTALLKTKDVGPSPSL